MARRKILIDCGTHLGMGCSQMIKHFEMDQEWEIFGFEANPYVFDAYVKNIKSEKYSVLTDKNIKIENKAVWISDEGVEFSLRGITQYHYDNYYGDDWKNDLATMVGEHNGLEVGEALKVPWDGGSCVSQLKNKINDTSERDKLYEWHEDVKVESFDLSQWIIDNFSSDDFIVLKMDIEGSEYEVLPKMIKDGSINYIDHAFIEWHDWVMPEYRSRTSELMNGLQNANVQLGGWG
jgi:FkbM family methyltransferase